MELYPGYAGASRIVHLSRASFFTEALCGDSVELDGEPELAMICPECDRAGRTLGGDAESWVTVAVVRIDFSIAA